MLESFFNLLRGIGDGQHVVVLGEAGNNRDVIELTGQGVVRETWNEGQILTARHALVLKRKGDVKELFDCNLRRSKSSVVAELTDALSLIS